jgi:integrase
MRKSRYQKGSVKKQDGRWVGMWWEGKNRKSRVLGLVRDMTKSDARRAVEVLATEANKRAGRREWTFAAFVIEVYFPFYERKWKKSTVTTNKNRVMVHLCGEFGSRPLRSFQRNELQELLDRKATSLSFSIVDHLRWDTKQIFGFALAEELIERNPADLLWTPREAEPPTRKTMTLQNVRACFAVLPPRERLIAKLAILGGMRPGEILALTWGAVDQSSAEIRQRVYRGLIDTPKTRQSVRKAALPKALMSELGIWRETAACSDEKAYVFPSENMTPLIRENLWRRYMKPNLDKASLGWATFQVMRRTHATLMKSLGIDGKLVADQLGHGLDVSQNVYTQSPVEVRLPAVNILERSLNGAEMEQNVLGVSVNC